MNNRDLLKEAIADAKAVKETAIANAKMALEEAFTPYLREKLSAKLAEMDEEDELKEADDKDGYEGQDSKEDLGTREMEEGREYDHYRGAEEDDAEHIKDLELDMKDDSEHTMDEMDLDELLRELGEMEEGEKEEMMEGEDLINNPTTTPTAHGNIAEEEEEVEVEVEDDEEIDLENMTEDDLKSFIEDVIADMVSAGELEAGEELEVEDEDEVEVEDEEDIEVEDEVEVTMDENARTRAEEEGYLDGEEDEKEDLKKDLKEAMNTVAILRSELNEINLLNAKLLYTNKVFRGKNLSENQKVKVLGAFDKAETVKEVKLVFETINSSVKSKTTNNSISEGFRAKGSASNLTSYPKVNKQPIVESNEMVLRFKKLAGII